MTSSFHKATIKASTAMAHGQRSSPAWRRVMKAARLLAAAGLVLPAVAWGEQGCPPGMWPVGTGCQTNYQLSLELALQLMPPKPILPAEDVHWGAIAMDKRKLLVTDKELKFVGVSNQQKTSKKAEQVALDMCRSDGSDGCQIVAALPSLCLSIAISPKANALEHFFATDMESANTIALLRCKIKHGEDCRSAYVACSRRDL
jgi:hypothetical protein